MHQKRTQRNKPVHSERLRLLRPVHEARRCDRQRNRSVRTLSAPTRGQRNVNWKQHRCERHAPSHTALKRAKQTYSIVQRQRPVVYLVERRQLLAADVEIRAKVSSHDLAQ